MRRSKKHVAGGQPIRFFLKVNGLRTDGCCVRPQNKNGIGFALRSTWLTWISKPHRSCDDRKGTLDLGDFTANRISVVPAASPFIRIHALCQDCSPIFLPLILSNWSPSAKWVPQISPDKPA